MPFPLIAAAVLLLSPPKDILRANLDTSVNPAVDFFQYANGGWIKRNPIPASESHWGIDGLIELELFNRLRKIDEDSARHGGAPGSPEQQVGDFWATAMDEAKAEQVGLSPLKADLDRIDAISTLQDAIDVAFEQQQMGLDSLFNFGVGQDDKHSDTMVVGLSQGGLGLHERDFYFNPEVGVAKVREEYVKYIQEILGLSGHAYANPDTAATDVMTFETSLARNSRKLEDLRDPNHNYNRMTLDQVESKLTPSIHWTAKLSTWHLNPTYVIVGQPEFYSGLEELLAKTPLDTLRDYLRFHLISRFAPYLNKEAEGIDFRFQHAGMSGQKEPRPRWKRSLDAENQAIGFVLGRVFVKSYFPESEKKRYSKLVEAIRKSFSERIDKLDWMSAATKAKAHQKLAAVRKKVGYPDKWKDYSKLVISRDSYCQNMMNAFRWQFDDMVSKFGKPVDRDEWFITPQTFDAYYNPSNNEIVLPAAAFAVPGTKDSDMDDALVYGNMGGSWIGHEMTHGFDDQGRQYDLKGNLKDWWTNGDAAKFTKRAQLMVKQFDAYSPLPGLHINGSACLGENIADYGGVLLGLDAFKKTEQYKRGKKIAGLTPVQRYFLGYTLSWLSASRPESLRRQLLSDVHSPAKWRVIGPLTNIPDFYKAFGVKPGLPMWRSPSVRVHIW